MRQTITGPGSGWDLTSIAAQDWQIQMRWLIR
jgi:hypothetical protein